MNCLRYRINATVKLLNNHIKYAEGMQHRLLTIDKQTVLNARGLTAFNNEINWHKASGTTIQQNKPGLIWIQQRRKSGKKQKNKSQDEDLDEDTDDDLSEFNDVPGKDRNLQKLKLTSLRIDLVLKSALKTSRNKIDTAFYESRIRLNGKKIAKKSVPIRDGNEIDLIKGISPTNPDNLLVSRVEVLSTKADQEEEVISMVVRTFKSLPIENYAGTDAYKVSEATVESE